MSTYTFHFQPDYTGTSEVTVKFDDTEHPCIQDVIDSFVQFLLGVTYQPGSIERFIDRKALERARTDKVRFMSEQSKQPK